MLGLWLENRSLSLRADLPEPVPSPGEARVKVLRAGICNTDLELGRGYYPYRGVLGHEFVGEVLDGPESLLGRRVVGEINAACGSCPTCRRGETMHCPQRTVLGIVDRDGAFAEQLVLPAENLHAVPDEISTDAATFTEPLAAALEIQQQVEVLPEHRVAVIGDGKLGQLIAQTLHRTGCRLGVVGRHPEKLARLRARGIDAVEALDEERSFDLAVECTGNPEGFELARRALRPRGTLVMKSTYADRLNFDAAAVVVDELTLIGSRCGPFAPALELLASRDVEVEGLIDARYPLARGLEAFEHAARTGVLKVLLDVA